MTDYGIQPEMQIQMKVEIIAEGPHNGMILHQSVNSGEDGKMSVDVMPKIINDWNSGAYAYALDPPSNNVDASRMISWHEQPTQTDLQDQEGKRSKSKREKHQSTKHRRKRKSNQIPLLADTGSEATSQDLDMTGGELSGDSAIRPHLKPPAGSVPVFPETMLPQTSKYQDRPVPAPRNLRPTNTRVGEEDFDSPPEPFIMPDHVRLNIFEEVEPWRFSDADIKRIESKQQPIVQHPVDTSYEQEAEPESDRKRKSNDRPSRSPKSKHGHVVPMETLTDTVTTTTTVEVFRTIFDADNPPNHLILPPPPAPGLNHQPQILQTNGPSHEIYTTKTTTDRMQFEQSTRQDAIGQIKMTKKEDGYEIPREGSTSGAYVERRAEKGQYKETVIDDPGIPITKDNSANIDHNAKSRQQQLTISPTIITDFPSELPILPPQISPLHVVKVDDLPEPLPDFLPAPPSPVPQIERTTTTTVNEAADQVEVKLFPIQRPHERPPLPPTQIRSENQNSQDQSGQNGIHISTQQKSTPSKGMMGASTSKIYEIYTSKSPLNLSYDDNNLTSADSSWMKNTIGNWENGSSNTALDQQRPNSQRFMYTIHESSSEKLTSSKEDLVIR